MKILKPINNGRFTSTDNLRNSIFLAGSCPRDNFADDWRSEAFEILKELGFNDTVIWFRESGLLHWDEHVYCANASIKFD